MAGTKASSGKLFAGLAERMKADKKFELAVYAVLLMLGVLIFAFSSCDGLNLGGGAGNASSGGAASEDEVEQRLEDILSSIEGAGAVRVMIVRAQDGSITGAIVTAEGAASIAVCEKLRNAVRVVLGIDIGQVEVYQMETNHGEDS
ncbi:MAG: hypothetical protein BWY35_01445 [Firmicutes bacterium ADurb.Bin248]|nr:MAG: hypothetical protein BWY35_01445 [Firmicutes bacterium ADurb.Bin248]HOG00367.1 hypothetical protein [Clostridia bacterium]HPK15605.1 hypothetical protein [Clostridia bacterium]